MFRRLISTWYRWCLWWQQIEYCANYEAFKAHCKKFGVNPSKALKSKLFQPSVTFDLVQAIERSHQWMLYYCWKLSLLRRTATTRALTARESYVLRELAPGPPKHHPDAVRQLTHGDWRK